MHRFLCLLANQQLVIGWILAERGHALKSSCVFLPQDEYCEWSVTRNSDNKITRIDFTCEGPEYWEYLGKVQPETVLEVAACHGVVVSTATTSLSQVTSSEPVHVLLRDVACAVYTLTVNCMS